MTINKWKKKLSFAIAWDVLTVKLFVHVGKIDVYNYP